MALAMIYPEPEKGGRGKKSEAKNLTDSGRVSIQRITEARFILRHTPDNAAKAAKLSEIGQLSRQRRTQGSRSM